MILEKFPKEKQLKKIQASCTHQYQSQVEKDAQKIMYMYKNQFTPMLSPYYNNGQIKNLLLLKGEFIQNKGTNYSIITSVGFPFIYPEIPAIIKIYNPDSIKFSINPHFIQAASKDYKFITINIQELIDWSSHTQIRQVMIALVQELNSYFPFFDKSIEQNFRNMQQILIKENNKIREELTLVQKQLQNYQKNLNILRLDQTTSVDNKCLICFDKEKQFTIVPCGHFIYCEQCIKQIKDKCMLCKSPINQILRIYQ